MASVSIKMPDTLKSQIEEKMEDEGYMNASEFIRQAVREKIEKNNQLHPDELMRLIKQGRDLEDDDSLTVQKLKKDLLDE